MLDERALTKVIDLAIRERDAILSALQADERSIETQQNIADWNAGRSEGIFPDGATTALLSQLRPRTGNGSFQAAYERAISDAINAGLGSHLLWKLEAAYNAHLALLDEAQNAYEQSSTQLIAIEDHCRAISALITVIQLYQPVMPDPGLTDNAATQVADIERVPQKPTADVAHSPDFRSVRWFGEHYSFTVKQAPVVRLLYENWQKETPDVGDETLLHAVDPEAPPERLGTLFREHSAWGTLIVKGGSKGTHRLAGAAEENQ